MGHAAAQVLMRSRRAAPHNLLNQLAYAVMTGTPCAEAIGLTPPTKGM